MSQVQQLADGRAQALSRATEAASLLEQRCAENQQLRRRLQLATGDQRLDAASDRQVTLASPPATRTSISDVTQKMTISWLPRISKVILASTV